MLAAELKKRGRMKVALLADDTPYGDSGVSAFSEAARLAGLDLLAVQRFRIGDTDMSAALKRSQLAGAQAVVGWGIGPELAAIARGIHGIKWKVPLYGSWTLSMRSFIDAAGTTGEGALMPQTFIQEAGAAAKNRPVRIRRLRTKVVFMAISWGLSLQVSQGLDLGASAPLSASVGSAVSGGSPS